MSETAEHPSPLELIEEQCNDDDRLHAAIPTERDSDDLYVLTVRVQPARDGNGRVLHLRTAVVDLLEQRAEWTSTGMVVPLTENLPLALGRSLVATSNTVDEDDVDTLIRNGLNAGDDSLAEQLLGVEGDADDGDSRPETSPGQEGYWEDLDGADGTASAPDRERTLTCEDCGAERPESEMMTVSLGAIEYHTCRGECRGEGEGDE